MTAYFESSNRGSRIFTVEDFEAIQNKIRAFESGIGTSSHAITSAWTGNIRWARNHIISSGDRETISFGLERDINGAAFSVNTGLFNDQTLKRAIEKAERYLQIKKESETFALDPLPYEKVPVSDVWHESTFDLLEEERAEVFNELSTNAEKEGMLSAGYMEVSGTSRFITASGRDSYGRFTEAQLSITVRSPDGQGSGWAGVSRDNWDRIDRQHIANVALDKCLRSRNPVAIEPGRYMVVLEPQAVYDIVNPLFSDTALNRRNAELNASVYSLSNGHSKLGLRIFDQRLKVYSDPYHPDCSFYPYSRSGGVYARATWVDKGVLTDLSYDRNYAISLLGSNHGKLSSGSFIIEGGGVNVDTMISNTERGLLVTRFKVDHEFREYPSLYSGLTRDGLWLIENGKISKAVRNLRFTESPLFVLNNIVEIGVPERVFSPGRPALVPAIRAQDFSFTATIDAI